MSAARPAVPISGLEELGLPADLITGEAVVLELRPASFATRAIALAIDVAVQFLVFFSTLTLVGVAFAELDDAAGAAATVVLVVLILLVVPVTVPFGSLTAVTRNRR